MDWELEILKKKLEKIGENELKNITETDEIEQLDRNDDYYPYLHKAAAFYYLGKYEKSLENINDSLKLEKKLACFYYKSLIEQALGNTQESNKYIKKAFNMFPYNKHINDFYNLSYLNLNTQNVNEIKKFKQIKYDWIWLILSSLISLITIITCSVYLFICLKYFSLIFSIIGLTFHADYINTLFKGHYCAKENLNEQLSGPRFRYIFIYYKYFTRTSCILLFPLLLIILLVLFNYEHNQKAVDILPCYILLGILLFVTLPKYKVFFELYVSNYDKTWHEDFPKNDFWNKSIEDDKNPVVDYRRFKKNSSRKTKKVGFWFFNSTFGSPWIDF